MIPCSIPKPHELSLQKGKKDSPPDLAFKMSQDSSGHLKLANPSLF